VSVPTNVVRLKNFDGDLLQLFPIYAALLKKWQKLFFLKKIIIS
jgi:hypothetical protein